MVAVGIGFAPQFFRLVRGIVREIMVETYIDAARTIGTSHIEILRRHVVPTRWP